MHHSFLCRPLVGCFLLLSASFLHAAPDVSGSKDNPQVKRVTGSQIVLYKFKAFDEMNLPLEAVEYETGDKYKDTKRQHVEGAHTVLYYLMPPDVGPFEAVHQYASELKEQNGAEDVWTPDGETPLEPKFKSAPFVRRTYPDIESLGLGYFHGFNDSDKRYGSFKGKSPNGGDLYVSVLAFPLTDLTGAPGKFEEMIKDAKGRTIARVDIIETKGMTTRMSTVKAEDITDSIAKTGKVAIYGVYFGRDGQSDPGRRTGQEVPDRRAHGQPGRVRSQPDALRQARQSGDGSPHAGLRPPGDEHRARRGRHGRARHLEHRRRRTRQEPPRGDRGDVDFRARWRKCAPH